MAKKIVKKKSVAAKASPPKKVAVKKATKLKKAVAAKKPVKAKKAVAVRETCREESRQARKKSGPKTGCSGQTSFQGEARLQSGEAGAESRQACGKAQTQACAPQGQPSGRTVGRDS